MKKKLTKTFVILLTCALLFAIFATAVGAESGRHRASLGDLDKSGDSNAKDYMMLKRYVLGTFELSVIQTSCADINLDGTVDSKDYMMLKRVATGTYELPKPDWDTPIAELTDKQLQERINYMLADTRETGKISVCFASETTAETIAAVFGAAGLSTDLQGTSVYGSSFTANDGTIWYDVKVSEEAIRDVMFVLWRSETVTDVEPYLLEIPA